jgi:hypothetical protein
MTPIEYTAFASIAGLLIIVVGILGGFVLRVHVDKANTDARITALERSDADTKKSVGRIYNEMHTIGAAIRRLELTLAKVLKVDLE